MEDIKFISVEDRLPIPQDLEEPCNDYYLIIMDQYRSSKAMYLEDENGECGWYLDYTAKIIRPVKYWAKID